MFIWADTQQEASHRYELILKCAVEFGIQFKPTKCCFFAMESDVLGHRVTQEGYFPTEKGVEIKSVTSCSTHKIDQQETDG